MADFSFVENEIITVLNRACEDLKSREATDTEWTLEIKSRLAKLGREKNYQINASGEGNNGEWLFDLVWYREEKLDGIDHLASLEMIMESEWIRRWSDVRDDFQKLLVAKAPLKLMLFDVANDKRLNEMIEKMRTALKAFRFKSPQERYLFGGYNNASGKFEYFLEVA